MNKDCNLWINSRTLDQEFAYIAQENKKTWFKLKTFLCISALIYFHVMDVYDVYSLNLLPDLNIYLPYEQLRAQDEQWILDNLF
jgi:hypothetical protein